MYSFLLGSEQWNIILKVLSIFSYFFIMAICTICGFVTEFMKQHMTNHGDDRKFQCSMWQMWKSSHRQESIGKPSKKSQF